MVEVVLGGMALSVAIAAILGAYIGQLTLNEHARNLSLAIQDANRVIERLREQNSPCAGTAPSAAVPPATGIGTCTAPVVSWDDWLQRCGGGKSIQPSELVVVTSSGTNPIQITAAVCWRHRNRTLGECTWNGTNLLADETLPMPSDSTAIDSPAMLTTLVTCR